MITTFIRREYRSLTDLTRNLLSKVDYYNLTTRRYLFTFEGKLRGPRLLNSLTVMSIEAKYKIKLASGLLYGPVTADLIHEIEQKSFSVTIEATGSTFKSMWDISLKTHTEHSGYVIFDANNRRLYFKEVFGRATANSMTDPYKAGEMMGYNNEVIANVHTHPQEHLYIGKRLASNPSQRVDDAYNFGLQYGADPVSRDPGDGRTAVTRQTSRYTISLHHIDFFSPNGRAASVNNLASAYQLFNNGFDLLKHAFEVYAGKRK